ncbi:hypothetical protein [Leeuwenhoekiella blandensis]|uniref:hypothetical protein n=1 Tax=Leeuwenhoekiella blandensis TaxID=360293 RepID=UPI002357EF1C|nr:hypothetical protein [Leeuwenhoekiella blandensis]|tara:strand:- start:49562 stop:52264 length:2703 start_codon:yes stop_codon:yes gene_type:complete
MKIKLLVLLILFNFSAVLSQTSLGLSAAEEKEIKDYKNSQKYLVTTIDNMSSLDDGSKWSVLLNANKTLKLKTPKVAFEDDFLKNLQAIDALDISNAEKFQKLKQAQAEAAEKERALRDETMLALQALNENKAEAANTDAEAIEPETPQTEIAVSNSELDAVPDTANTVDTEETAPLATTAPESNVLDKKLQESTAVIAVEETSEEKPEEISTAETTPEDQQASTPNSDQNLVASLAEVSKGSKAASQESAQPEEVSNTPATVYFIRNNGFAGSGTKFHIFIDTDYKGKIKGKDVIKTEVSPGQYKITGVSGTSIIKSAYQIPVTFEAGQTYYFSANNSGMEYLELATMNTGVYDDLQKKLNKNIDYVQVDQKDRDKYTERFNEILQEAEQFPSQVVANGKPVAGRRNTSFQEDYPLHQGTGLSINDVPSNTGLTDANGTTINEYIDDIAAAKSSEEMVAIAQNIAGIDTEAPLLNLRDQAYKEILKLKEKEGFRAVNTSTSNVLMGNVEARDRVKNSEVNETTGLKYRRSSLYTLMINDDSREHFGHIRNTFGNIELSEKFNNHNIGPYLINTAGGIDDQTEAINQFFIQNQTAKELVAKWFNRDVDGNFDMEVIANRGSYNASDLDVLVAQDSQRGQALLEDAGEELIKNTFVIVYDFKYTNKEEKAKKTGGFLSALSTAASFVPGMENVSTVVDGVNLAQTALGKGYFVKTTAYLYQLEWNEEVASRFYNEMWMDENSYDPNRKAAFDNTDIFKLKFIGTQIARKNLQSTIFSNKTNKDLIGIATVRASDKSIAQLQREFEDFRVKTPLLSGDPIAAKIGTKEGIEKGDKFEVLEQVLGEDGKTYYERVGTIKVDKNEIWDNSYLAEEDTSANLSGQTLFKGSSNKYYSGMLIRQIN